MIAWDYCASILLEKAVQFSVKLDWSRKVGCYLPLISFNKRSSIFCEKSNLGIRKVGCYCPTNIHEKAFQFFFDVI
jgi:hypothetical protein